MPKASHLTRLAIPALAVLGLFGSATPAAAANNQSGLVNVYVQGITVQVPIGVAANVCDISAAVLAAQARSGSANCTAASTSNALNRAIAGA